MNKNVLVALALMVGVGVPTAIHLTEPTKTEFIRDERGGTILSRTGNVISFNSGFSWGPLSFFEEMLADITSSVEPDERALIVVTSPGGLVAEGERVMSRMDDSDVKFDTYVPSYAASMGGDLFLRGERRFVDKNASLIFHGASNSGLGAYQWEIVVQIMEDPAFNALLSKVKGYTRPQITLPDGAAITDTSQEEAAIIEDSTELGFSVEHIVYLKVAIGLSAINATEGLKTAKRILQGLHLTNSSLIEPFLSAIEGSNGKITREMIEEELFGNYEADVITSGARLIELGIAEEAPKGLIDSYKDQG